jgi:hypothetical protein
MKYNKSFGGEPFENYKRYLETIQDKLPKPLYDFVSDSKRHDLGEQSLHDTWVNEIEVKVIRDKENRYREKVSIIKVELLGSYHDRTFNLNFNDVTSYQLGVGKFGHCDLITYEIYCESEDDHNILTFNAAFADESVIIIKAGEITITEKFL